MEKNSIEEAVGFEMNNLKKFQFSRLPIGPQLEVIDELPVKERIELFNVNSGLREYLTRNGPFGRHVDWIETHLRANWFDHRNEVDVDYVEKDQSLLPSDLSYNQKKLLLRKIRSCEKFFIGRTRPTQSLSEWMNLPLSDEEAENYFVDCFRSLCLVSELWSSKLEIPVYRNVLTALQFEVTDWAWLDFQATFFYQGKDFSALAEFLKSYLEKQLKNCKKVLIIDWGEVGNVLKEIPGFQHEEDPNKAQEILEAFDKIQNKDLMDSSFSKIKCYRRKIGEDEQGLVLTAKYAEFDDSD